MINPSQDLRLPTDIQSEQFVLGACLNDPDAAQQVVETAEQEDFFLAEHRTVYRVIQELFHSGRHIGRETVARELRATGDLDKLGGLAFLLNLDCPTLVGLSTYLRSIRETAIVRRAIAETSSLLESLQCYKNDTGAVLETAESLVNVLSSSKGKSDRPRTVWDVVEQAGGTEKFLNPPGYGITIPFKILNRTLMGLRKRKLIFCAARPAVGKTALMQQIAEAAALQKYRSLVVSAEMDATDILHRSICGRADASMYRFIEGTMSEEERRKVHHELTSMIDLDDYLLFDDDPNIDMQRISAMLRYQKSIGKPVDLLLIDYVQLIGADEGVENRTQELARISKGLVKLKKKFQIPIFVLAQINREGGKEDEPTMSHLKECGQLEQDADAVLLMWLHKKEQEAETLEPLRPSRQVNWKIDKNRGGWTNRGGWNDRGECHNPLMFWKTKARFQEDLEIVPREIAA